MNVVSIKKKTYLEVLFLVLISALVYLPYATRLTYYLDDWYYIYNDVVAGPNIFHSMFSIDRPARGYFFDIYFSLFGLNPFPYHLGAYLWRLLAGLSAFWLFNILWPGNGRLVFFSALFLIIYPGYSWWISAIEYQPMIASLALQVFSFVMTLEAIKASKFPGKIIYQFWAILAGWAYIALVDYAIGMEIFRLLCVHLLVSQREQASTIFKKIFISIKAWVWNIFIPSGFIIWRCFFFESQRKATDINFQLSKFWDAPMDALWRWCVNLFESVADIGFYAWFKQFYIKFADAGFELSATGLVIAAGGLILLIVIAHSLGNPNSVDDDKPQKREAGDAIFLGSVSLVLGVLPVIALNRYVNLTRYSHYGLPASLGSAVLLVGLIFYIFSPGRARFILISAFVIVAILTHSLIAEKAITLENSLENFWWQASWRIPSLRPDTTLVTLYPYEEAVDNELGLVEPVNLIYFPDPQGQIPIREPVSTLMPTDDNIYLILTQHRRKTEGYRTHQMIINYSNILILTQPTSLSCVRVIDGTNHVFSEDDPENIRKISAFSRIENIRPRVDDRTPPEFAFGPEPDHRWCYFFEKADLAVQSLDWEDAARAGDEALALGLYPSDQVEWFPFIQAYAMMGDEDKLEMISMQTRSNVSFKSQVCEAFHGPNSALGLSLRIRNLIDKLFCD